MSELWTRIHWIWIRIRIWIQHFKRIRIQIMIQSGSRVLTTKNWRKKYSRNFSYLFWSKIAIYLCPSNRSLHPPKENIQHFKKLLNFFYVCALWVIFALLDPDCEPWSGCGSRDPIESGSRHGSESRALRNVIKLVYFMDLPLSLGFFLGFYMGSYRTAGLTVTVYWTVVEGCVSPLSHGHFLGFCRVATAG